MVFFVERASACAGSAVVIRGVARVMIPYRPKSFRGFHSQIVLFVNSLAGSAYGSPSLDCYHPLRHWPRGLVGI